MGIKFTFNKPVSSFFISFTQFYPIGFNSIKKFKQMILSSQKKLTFANNIQ